MNDFFMLKGFRVVLSDGIPPERYDAHCKTVEQLLGSRCSQQDFIEKVYIGTKEYCELVGVSTKQGALRLKQALDFLMGSVTYKSDDGKYVFNTISAITTIRGGYWVELSRPFIEMLMEEQK